MGVDIGIYCTVDKEVALSDSNNTGWDLDYWETLGGDPLVRADCCTPFGDYCGVRLHRIPGWIGDLLRVIEEARSGKRPYLKKVYIFVVIVTETFVKLQKKLWLT